jgi:hypothetical protein
MSNQYIHDPRKVALIKSLATKNRFYTLVTEQSGIHNADALEEIPDGYILGIAYPCLEDGLNDFAVIRTTFETLDYFPEDDPLREEMMDIINSARQNLILRLQELRDKIAAHLAHFLGTDYNEFKQYAMDIVTRGYSRRNLDAMMKLNVFSSVAETEGYSNANEMLYFLEFALDMTAARAKEMRAHDFVVFLFEDILYCVLDDANYKSKYTFDRNVFQKFIAIMFVNYATTDPVYYGINKADYGVSADKDMDSTPLYVAIKKELLAIEHRLREEGINVGIAATESRSLEDAAAAMPAEILTEEVIMGHISSLCSAAGLLKRKSDSETQRMADVILTDASKLIAELKTLGILSPFVVDPCGGC